MRKSKRGRVLPLYEVREQWARCVYHVFPNFHLLLLNSSLKDCTYLRPVGRPGPIPGAVKRTLTLRNTPFSKRRALSTANYKELMNKPISLADESKDAAPIDAETWKKTVQPSVNPTEPCSGLQSESGSGLTFSCSEDDTSGSLGRILNPTWSCTSTGGSKLSRTDVQQNVQRLEGDVRKSHRPLLWVRTRSDMLDSTTARNKKHLVSFPRFLC